jgi:hypothetical protein
LNNYYLYIQTYRYCKKSRNKLSRLLLVMKEKRSYSNSSFFVILLTTVYIYVLLINRLDLPSTLSCFSYPYILSYVIERACVRLTLLASNWLNRERLSMEYSYCLSVCVTRQLICHRKTISASSDCLL